MSITPSLLLISLIYFKISATLNTTININAINSGMIAILRAFPNLDKRPDFDEVVTSFCTSRPNSTKIPIKATEPAIATVVTVVIVEVVTVDIISPP